MTVPAIFWNFELCWQIFFSACLATLSLSVFDAWKSHEPVNITNAGAIKFGSFVQNPYTASDLPFFLIMGVFGGILGSFFVSTNYFMGKMRKKYLTSRFKKFLETMFFVGVTATIIYFAPSFLPNPCLNDQDSGFPET